ncbi:Uma2 family endonuclease [Ectothiorhodospiraceae bacterium BW-2]|nr:Uma2 family endonuclease [Ectothiorhodospiraceae bacterium BW-2]
MLNQTLMTPDEYLTWEAQQTELKHEYVDGEIYAMVGARRLHVVATGNIFAALKSQLRGSKCRAYANDLKLRLLNRNAFYYPDIVVTCSAADNGAELYITEPTLIVEVLSESTEAYDRNGKFAAYRTIETLQEYWLVDIDEQQIEIFRRAEQGDWLYHCYRRESDAALPVYTLELTLPMSELFEDINPILADDG